MTSNLCHNPTPPRYAAAFPVPRPERGQTGNARRCPGNFPGQLTTQIQFGWESWMESFNWSSLASRGRSLTLRVTNMSRDGSLVTRDWLSIASALFSRVVSRKNTKNKSRRNKTPPWHHFIFPFAMPRHVTLLVTRQSRKTRRHQPPIGDALWNLFRNQIFKFKTFRNYNFILDFKKTFEKRALFRGW